MGTKNQIRAGVYLSYLNLGLSTIIPLVYTPIMLEMLGQNEYGLYSLSSSAVAYLSLLSFGFGSTIVRYISKYRAEEKVLEEEQSLGFFIKLYTVLAIIVFACGCVIANNVEPIFHRGLNSKELVTMKKIIYIMAFNSALSFPVSVFSSVVIAHERYVFRKLVDMLCTVAAPVANLVALCMGYKSVGMAVAGTILQCFVLPMNALYCFRVLEIKPIFYGLPKKIIKEMFSFSLFIFIGSIVDILFWSTDKIILGMLSGTVAVAIYNVGGTFNNMVMNLSTSISGVLTPKITGMVVQDVSKKELTDLFIKVGRLQFIIIGLIVSGFTVFGPSFIRLWAGEDYANAYWVAVLTMFPLCIPLIQNTGLSIVVAQNKHQFRSIVYLIIAIANVISTYIVVPRMGYIGAALCSCVAYIVGQGFVMNIYYYRVTGINIPLFWKNILKMAIIPGGMMFICIAIRKYVVINGWLIFLMGVSIYTLIYIILMYCLILNEYEKNIFIQPLKHIGNKINLN